MRNYQLQSARTSSIGKKEGRRQARLNFKLRKPTGWRPSGKKPPPPPSQGEKKKAEEMRMAHRAPEGSSCAQTGPRSRGPLPRLLLCLRPAAPGRAAGALMRSRHWDGGPLVAQLGQGPGHASGYGRPGALLPNTCFASSPSCWYRAHQPLVAPHCDERVFVSAGVHDMPWQAAAAAAALPPPPPLREKETEDEAALRVSASARDPRRRCPASPPHCPARAGRHPEA